MTNRLNELRGILKPVICQCGKICYSGEDTVSALTLVRRQYKTLGIRNYYVCEISGAWHLTSKPKRNRNGKKKTIIPNK